MIAIEQIFEPALAAAGYSLLWYGRRRMQTGEPFTPSRFAATVLVGAGLGVVLAVAGVDVTQVGIETRLAAYAGVVSLVEAILKGSRDAYKSRRAGREAQNGD